jgi:hypothetical protein
MWLQRHADLASGKAAMELSELLGRDVSRSAVTSRRYRDKKAGREQQRDLAPSRDDAPQEENEERPSRLEAWTGYAGDMPHWREMVEVAQRAAELQQRMRPVELAARRRIVTEFPVHLVLMSDFHLGSPHTDYSAFIETTDFIRSRESFYLAVVGPDQETAFSWFRSAEAIEAQVLPSWMQIELYRQWLDEMLPRTVAVCGDNHTDERLERYLGDIGLTWREDVPYFRAQGLLELRIGPDDPERVVTYRILMAHRYKGHSIYHDLQPVLRMMRDIDPTCDVYVTAHTHTPAYLNGVFYERARERGKADQHFIVTGTFKTGADLYSLRNFGGSGILGLPTLKLWPGTYAIQYYAGPELAVL